MRRSIWLILSVLVACGLTSLWAQQNGATRIQHDPSMLNACTSINATAAVNTTATVTIPAPPSGTSVYICGIDLSESFNASGPTVATNLTFTSTNFGGWLWKYSSPGVASTTVFQSFYFTQPVKAPLPSTAVTFVSPAINATGAYSINVYYLLAP